MGRVKRRDRAQEAYERVTTETLLYRKLGGVVGSARLALNRLDGPIRARSLPVGRLAALVAQCEALSSLVATAVSEAKSDVEES